MEIGLPVPEKKIFKGFYHIWEWRLLGHVTSIMSSDFHFFVPESFHKKFGSDRQSSFWEKSALNFGIYTILGQGQEMTLTFNTHIFSYIQLDDCSY